MPEVKSIIMVKGYDVQELISIKRAHYLPDFTEGSEGDPLDRAKVYAEYIMRTSETIFETYDVLFVDFNKWLAAAIFCYRIGEAQSPEDLMHNRPIVYLVVNANKYEDQIMEHLDTIKKDVAGQYYVKEQFVTDDDARIFNYRNRIMLTFDTPLLAACVDNIDFVKMNLSDYIARFICDDKPYPMHIGKKYLNNVPKSDIGFFRFNVQDFDELWYSNTDENVKEE